MAIVGSLKNEVKTGDNFAMKVSNAAAWVPWVGAPVALLAGKVGTLWDAAGWAIRGKFSSAGSALASGAAATATNTLVSSAGLAGFAVQAGTKIASGKAAGDFVRGGAEVVTEKGFGLVGVKPQVYKSYPAAVVGTGNSQGATGPGKFLSEEAKRRGQNPDEAWARLNSNEPDHVAALQAAQARGSELGR